MNYYALEDGTYYLPESMMNGLLPAGTYLIQDGKIIVRNGMYEENGKLYYFENNNKVKAGAVQIGDDIYYFGMNYYALPDGTYYITESMMNGLLPAGTYRIQNYKIVVE